MAKGEWFKSECAWEVDPETGAAIRRITSHPSIHHHPYFFISAYDDAMRRLVFVSHRHGRPEVFAEDQATGRLLQVTDRADLNEWSLHPSRDGRYVYFTAGISGWRLDTETLEEQELLQLAGQRPAGMVASAMGTTALSPDDRFWAVACQCGATMQLTVFDTHRMEGEVILERESIGHMQFCPDDPELLFYAGPLNDRVWCIRRDGRENRRLYQRNASEKEWITHEIWLPGRRELAFVDWPRGVRAVSIDTGETRWLTRQSAWHVAPSRDGASIVFDTNAPDVGIHTMCLVDDGPRPRRLCRSDASNMGAHWHGPFPYENGPIPVHAPQHTHPHPTFSPDGRRILFTSDRTGHAQLYECFLGGRPRHASIGGFAEPGAL